MVVQGTYNQPSLSSELSGFIDFKTHLGGCQNYGSFLGRVPIIIRHLVFRAKRDHNSDHYPFMAFKL